MAGCLAVGCAESEASENASVVAWAQPAKARQMATGTRNRMVEGKYAFQRLSAEQRQQRPGDSQKPNRLRRRTSWGGSTGERWVSASDRHVAAHGGSKQGKPWLRTKGLAADDVIVVQCTPSSTADSLLREAL
jgi:hypothetical protein